MFWSLGFQSRPPQILQVQFFVLASKFAFRVALGEGKAGLSAACRTAQHSGHPETWAGFEILLEVCFQGREESEQLCSLTEGFSIRCCRYFSSFVVKWGASWRGPDRQPGIPRVVVWKSALVSQGTLGGSNCWCKAPFFVIRGEKYLLHGPHGATLWELTEITSRKQILRLFSADDVKKAVLSSAPQHWHSASAWGGLKVSCDHGLVL